MTIRLPGILDEINPMALQGISGVVNNIVNPNAPQQMALRQMMLQNPELQQQLTDMGAQRVEQVYGKGTGGFAGSGPKSLKKQVEDTKGAEIQRILTSGTPQEKEELLSGLVGTKTSSERKLQDLQTTGAQQQVQMNQTKIDDQAAVDTVSARIHARIGAEPMGSNLYELSQKGAIKPDELMTLLKDPAYERKYNNDQQDHWSKINAGLEQQRINAMKQGNRMQFQEYKDRIDYSRAAQIAEKYGGSADAVLRIQRSPALWDKVTAPDFKAQTDEDRANVQAAQNIQRMQNDLYGEAKVQAMKEFRLATQKEDGVLYSRGATPQAKADAVREKNNKARDILGGAFKPNEIPEWHYDDKLNKHVLGISLGGDQFYRSGGDPNLFGSTETYVPKPTGTPSKDPLVETVAAGIIGGKYKENEAIATAKDDAQRQEIRRRVAELRQGVDSTAVSDTTPGSAAISTGADSTVKASLKIPRGEPINLNVGTSVSAKPDTTGKGVSDSFVNRNDGKKAQFSFVLKAANNATEKSTPVRTAALKSAVDTLTDSQVLSIINHYKREGYLPSDAGSVSAQRDVTTNPAIDLNAVGRGAVGTAKDAGNAYLDFSNKVVGKRDAVTSKVKGVADKAAGYYSEENFLKEMNKPAQFTLLKAMLDAGKLDNDTFTTIVTKARLR